MPSIDEAAKAWQEQLAKRVGLAIRDRRTALGFTAQQLSEQTRSLGYPVSRAAIAKIESNSRSGKLDVAELLALSVALFVPPVALVFPGPYDDEIDVLPALKAMQFDAAQWFSGLSNETFGVQSEALNSARNLIDKSELGKIAEVRKATAGALELLQGLEKLIADGDPEKLRLLEEERRSAGDA